MEENIGRGGWIRGRREGTKQIRETKRCVCDKEGEVKALRKGRGLKELQTSKKGELRGKRMVKKKKKV